MIQTGGCDFKVITQPIYVNRKRVREVWVNGVKVYPVEEVNPILRYAMYFEFGSMVISKYSSTPVNQYGAYVKVDSDLDLVYRAAFAVTTSGEKTIRQAFLSCRGYVSAGSIGMTYVPYVADSSKIIVDGLSYSGINTFELTEQVIGGKCYYQTKTINANLEDADGNKLTNYTVSTGSDNCRVFYSADEAINYVLG